MIEILQHIKEQLNDNFILVGGYSRVLQGYETEYNKSDIDIVISPEWKDKLKEIGRYGEIDNQFFPYPILEQFVILYNRDFFLDVFVSDRNPQWKRIQGIKCATLEDDLSHFNLLYEIKNHSYFSNKISKVKNLL